MKFSIIIPTLNRPEAVKNTIQNLFNQDFGDFEIIIIDQSSDEYVKKDWPNDRRIIYKHVEFRNVARAKNIGIDKAKGEIIFFCDDDVHIADPLFLTKMLTAFNEAGIDCVVPRIIPLRHNILGVIRERRINSIKKCGYIRWFDRRPISNWDNTASGFVAHAAGVVAYRRQAVKAVKYFDEEFGKGHAYLEDTDFSLRAKSFGFRPYFFSKIYLYHLKMPTGGCRVFKKESYRYWFCRNYRRYIKRHFPKFWPVAMVQQILQELLYSILKGDPKTFKYSLKGILGMRS